MRFAGHPDIPDQLRILSYNIQNGVRTNAYHQYLTGSWKHVLPFASRQKNLDSIAGLISDFDFVGLQEADGGSLRSGFVNQTEYLALKAGMPHWYSQTNRNLGSVAQHSNGFITRFKPDDVIEYKLPGRIPGRGAMAFTYGQETPLLVVVMHLALGRSARLRQFGFLSELIEAYPHVIIMGDMNCTSVCDELQWLVERCHLREPIHELATYPSWQPEKNIDHILVTPNIEVLSARVLPHYASDHLPVCMEVKLPSQEKIAA